MQAGVNHIDGMVRYISHIERESWPSLRQEWKDILLDNDERPSYEPLIEREIRHLHFFIDETEINYESKNILALAFVITEDANKVNASTLATLRDYLDKAFVGGNKEKLRKEGLHYSAADEDLRNSYIEKLPVLPFDGYLIYGELGNYSSYEDLYLSLIRKILPHRLMWCNYSAVRIIFEENKSKVSPEKIKQVVATVYNELLATNNRRPIQEPEVIIGKKAEYPGFSVPDFLLALFSKYARQNDRKLDKNYANIVDREERQFERLRDKYRLIIDADNKKVYQRNRPFSPWLKGDNKNAAVA